MVEREEIGKTAKDSGPIVGIEIGESRDGRETTIDTTESQDGKEMMITSKVGVMIGGMITGMTIETLEENGEKVDQAADPNLITGAVKGRVGIGMRMKDQTEKDGEAIAVMHPIGGTEDEETVQVVVTDQPMFITTVLPLEDQEITITDMKTDTMMIGNIGATETFHGKEILEIGKIEASLEIGILEAGTVISLKNETLGIDQLHLTLGAIILKEGVMKEKTGRGLLKDKVRGKGCDPERERLEQLHKVQESKKAVASVAGNTNTALGTAPHMHRHP